MISSRGAIENITEFRSRFWQRQRQLFNTHVGNFAPPASDPAVRVDAGAQDLPTPQVEVVAVPEQTLDLFEYLEPDLFDESYTVMVEEFAANPVLMRSWMLERAESCFDKRHKEIFCPGSFEKAKQCATVLGHPQTQNTLTLVYYEVSELAHAGDHRPADLTILMIEDYGQKLLKEYYEKKHGMTIIDIHLHLPDIFITWDMTQVNQQRRKRWRSRIVSDISMGQRCFNGELTFSLLTLSRVFMDGRGSQQDGPLVQIRSFVGNYDDHLHSTFANRKRARGK